MKYLDLAVLDRKVILPELLTKTYLPNYTAAERADFIEVNSWEVQLLKLDDFIISGGSSSFIKSGNVYIERYFQCLILILHC